jgi:hypothetical protein
MSFLIYISSSIFISSVIAILVLIQSKKNALIGVLFFGISSLLFLQGDAAQKFLYSDSFSEIKAMEHGPGGHVALLSTNLISVNGQKMGHFPNEVRTVKQWSATKQYFDNPDDLKSALVLGLGAGQIVRELLSSDLNVEKIVVIDWSPHLRVLLQKLDPVFSDKRIEYIHGDAAVLVRKFNQDEFDLVFDNLSFAYWVVQRLLKFRNFMLILRGLQMNMEYMHLVQIIVK